MSHIQIFKDLYSLATLITGPHVRKVPTASKYAGSTIKRGRGRTSGDGAREASGRNGKITERAEEESWRAETTV